jgi:hypothetical protein
LLLLLLITTTNKTTYVMLDISEINVYYLIVQTFFQGRHHSTVSSVSASLFSASGSGVSPASRVSLSAGYSEFYRGYKVSWKDETDDAGERLTRNWMALTVWLMLRFTKS